MVGEVEAGDRYTVDIDGSSVSYTAQENDTLSSVRSGLISSLNYDATLSGIVQAQSDGSDGTIILTAVTAGDALATTVTVVNGGSIENASASVTSLNQ